MSIRAFALTAGIFGAATMFFLAWWLILTGNAEGPPTLFERIYIGYSFTPKEVSLVLCGALLIGVSPGQFLLGYTTRLKNNINNYNTYQTL